MRINLAKTAGLIVEYAAHLAEIDVDLTARRVQLTADEARRLVEAAAGTLELWEDGGWVNDLSEGLTRIRAKQIVNAYGALRRALEAEGVDCAHWPRRRDVSEVVWTSTGLGH